LASRHSSSLLASGNYLVLPGRGSQGFQSRGEDRWAHRIGTPLKKKFGRGAADSSLTRPHATAGVQFCSSPGGVTPDLRQRYIFAAAHDIFRLPQASQLGSQLKRFIQENNKTLQLVPIA